MADDSPSSARVTPKKKDFSWVRGGYQVTSPRGVAAIAAKRGGANPYGNPAGVAMAEWLQAPPVDNPNIVNPVAAPNPALAGDTSTPPPAPTQTFPSGRPDGPVLTNPNSGGPAGQTDEEKTPEQRAADERRRWLADGGSIATMHRAEAKSGLRPRIDARGNPAALNSNAAAEIRQGWGWDPSVTTGSQGAPIAAEMTKNFTAAGSRSGDQNANWNKKFEDARSRLQASLKS